MSDGQPASPLPASPAARPLRSGPTGQSVVDQLVALLDLEHIDDMIFRGVSPKVPLPRVFGGQVAAQALVAAGRTVDASRRVHSLHAYFIRAGDPEIPILFTVDPVRDGGSFSVRRVLAIQHGKAIFSLSASFQIDQPGMDYATEPPDVPRPEKVPTLEERFAQFPDGAARALLPRPFEMRYVDDPPWARTGAGRAQRVWMRAAGRLPDDPLTHVCALTFASDLTLLESVLAWRGMAFGIDDVVAASLDHAMWFHRPFRADEWFLYESEALSASGSRGLAAGKIYSEQGEHLVTVMQEGLVRLQVAAE